MSTTKKLTKITPNQIAYSTQLKAYFIFFHNLPHFTFVR